MIFFRCRVRIFFFFFGHTNKWTKTLLASIRFSASWQILSCLCLNMSTRKRLNWNARKDRCWKITLLRWDIRGTLIMEVIQTNRPKQNICKQTCERCLVTIKGPRVGTENFVLMNSLPNSLGGIFFAHINPTISLDIRGTLIVEVVQTSWPLVIHL